MLLVVRVAEWELEEDGRILSVSDEGRFWLTFQEGGRWAPPAERVNVIRGVAVPLAAWPGAEFGRHPVQINLDGGALYWDAPQPVTGPIEVVGTVSTNVDAPDGFPETAGVLRRLRMERQNFVMGPDGAWRGNSGLTEYEEVTRTYLPDSDTKALDPAVEAELSRQARAAYDRELAAGRVKPGDPFEITLPVPRSARTVPLGTIQTRWTGVLIDLEIGNSING